LVSSCEDSSGTVWLLTGNGLLGRYQDGKMNVAPAGCKKILAEKSGTIWLGTDHGLFAIQNAPGSAAAFIVQQSIPIERRLDYLLASESGGYWRLADGKIEKWNGARRERVLTSYPWSSNVLVTAACEDGDGNLIVGTYGEGVYWFDANGNFTRLSDELSHKSVLSMVVDREGDLWIGTNGGGLDRVKRKKFGVLAASQGWVVQSACPDGRGGLWIGYNGNRVDHWENGTAHSFSLVKNSDPKIAENAYVKSVFMDRAGTVWAGMESPFGSRLFEFKNGAFQEATEAGVLNQNISCIFQDRSGAFWIGTQGGLARRDGNHWTALTTRDGLPGDEIRGIAEDTNSTLWIATGAGLASLKNGKVDSFRKKDGLPNEDLSCVYADGEGVLWIGTRGSGLIRFDGKKWTHYTMRQGLSGNSIGYLIEDEEENLWLGSNAGLMRVPKKSLTDFANGLADSITCRAYVEADGLPTRECTQGSQPAACRTGDGALWFPTTRGLVNVNPANLKPNPYQPPVRIESVLVDGKLQNTNRLRITPVQTVTIPARKEHLEIHYTSLNLGAARQSKFRYRLDSDEKWSEVGEAREARFPKLPAGEYHFEVTACNEDGEWNPNASALTIIVQPPFWKTAWFLAIASLGLLGIVVGSVHYFSTQKLQRQLAILKQQEELERERARIARDLHDQLGANLMQVALLGELAEGDKNIPEEVEEHAKQITQTAKETAKALDEIVWAVNPSNDTLDGLVTYICKYAQEYFELAGLRYRLDIPADLPKVELPPDVRHNVFLAAKEAINNVVKHAQASEAWLRLKLEPDRFTLEIEDDGRGPGGMTGKTGRNGLRNMRKRLEDIHGAFSIEPGAERGSIVRLSAPVKQR
jgi:signal transduction histidine kinase/ligand-binding sensor domain-containing protein